MNQRMNGDSNGNNNGVVAQLKRQIESQRERERAEVNGARGRLTDAPGEPERHQFSSQPVLSTDHLMCAAVMAANASGGPLAARLSAP